MRGITNEKEFKRFWKTPICLVLKDNSWFLAQGTRKVFRKVYCALQNSWQWQQWGDQWRRI